MAKRKPIEINPLAGQEITIVAKKKGQIDKQKDVAFEQAMIYKKQFEAKGWSVQLYQKGFYQPFNINKIPRL